MQNDRNGFFKMTRQDHETGIQCQVYATYKDTCTYSVVNGVTYSFFVRMLRHVNIPKETERVEIRMLEDGILDVECEISAGSTLRFFVHPKETI
jgi:hypothetical protein